MRRLAVVGVAVAVLIVGACGGDEEPLGPTATVPQPTTTTNPYAVPTVIDETYVNRVLMGLDQAAGDILRMVMSSRTLPTEAVDRLKAIAVGDALQLKVDSFQSELFDEFSGYRENPGNTRTVVTKLLSVTGTCLFLEVTKDFSAVTYHPDPRLSRQWVALVPLDFDQRTSGFNPTGWAFTYDGFRRDLSAPDDPCVDS